jgi:pyruvate/2-oxoglutarate dehydrogenase complex dihydrolipoamide dehydrogenase (E3) component
MVASARVAYLARRGADYGVETGPNTVDMTVVRRRKRDIVNNFRGGSERRIEQTPGLDLLMGEARFTGERALDVRLNDGGTRSLVADLVVINTGERPSVPPIPGLDRVPFLNSTSIMELAAVPDHLIVIGGGYVGLEFGQMFRRFGSKVTIVQRGGHLLSREDDDVADAVADILRQDGVEVLLRNEPVRVEPGTAGGNGQAGPGVRVIVRTSDGDRTLDGSHLLVAAGRTPNTEHLDPGAAGVKTDARGYIVVDDRLATSAPGVYAIGDVKGPPAFTHISYDDFRILRANLLCGGHETITGRLVPYTVFIDPQLGRVGLSEREARQQGRDVRVAKLPMNYVARALEVDESRGFMKAVVDTQSKQILGCAVLGIEGGELMAMFEIAMMGHLPYTVLKDAIFAHPTLAESLNNLFMALDGE